MKSNLTTISPSSQGISIQGQGGRTSLYLEGEELNILNKELPKYIDDNKYLEDFYVFKDFNSLVTSSGLKDIIEEFYTSLTRYKIFNYPYRIQDSVEKVELYNPATGDEISIPYPKYDGNSEQELIEDYLKPILSTLGVYETTSVITNRSRRQVTKNNVNFVDYTAYNTVESMSLKEETFKVDLVDLTKRLVDFWTSLKKEVNKTEDFIIPDLGITSGISFPIYYTHTLDDQDPLFYNSLSLSMIVSYINTSTSKEVVKRISSRFQSKNFESCIEEVDENISVCWSSVNTKNSVVKVLVSPNLQGVENLRVRVTDVTVFNI